MHPAISTGFAALLICGLFLAVNGEDGQRDDRLDVASFEALRDDDLDAAAAAFAEVLERDPANAFAHAWLGQIAVRQGDLARAEHEFASAVSKVEARMAAEDGAEEYARQAKKAQLRLSLDRVRGRRAAALLASAAPMRGEEAALSIEPILRVHRRELSHARFAAEFARARRPLVIQGFAEEEHDSLTRPYLSVARLRELCGALPAPLRRHARSAATWASLEDLRAPRRTFATHLDELGRGTSCGLHVDSDATHFWQFVATGRKHWRVFAAQDWPRLFEDEEAWRRAFFRDARCSGLFGAAADEAAGCDDRFGGAAVDAFDDAALRRLAVAGGSTLTVHEAVLEAGEALFVPAGAPHQVLNLGGVTTAVSMNYIDGTNAADALEARHANPELHIKFRSRLQKRGKTVPGSRARWFERFRMPVESEAERHQRAVARRLEAAFEPPLAETPAFLVPWNDFAARWWNRNLTDSLTEVEDRQRAAISASGLPAAEPTAATLAACVDGNLGFGGVLQSRLGFESEGCTFVVPTFAGANQVDVPVLCGVALSDIAAGLAAEGVVWAPPSGARLLSDICCATCEKAHL